LGSIKGGRMKWIIFSFSIFTIVLGCKKQQPKGKILAKVGETILFEDEFYALLPVEEIVKLTPSQKKELLKKWIDTELVYQEARKEGIDKEEDIRIKLKELERELVANAFIERYLAKIGSVDEQEVRKYYDTHKEEFGTERKVAQIVVTDSAVAEELRTKLLQGEDFSKIAKEYSIDPSRVRGGVLGYIRRGDMPQLPELEEAIFKLKKEKEISPLVKTIYGYHLIKLIDIKKLPSPPTFQEVEDEIRAHLNLMRKKESFNKFLDTLRKKVRIEVHYELFE